MEILAAVFIDTIDVRPVPGPSTRIDLGGIKFSEPAAGPLPVTVEPHLVVLVRCADDGSPDAVLETTYFRDGEQIARNVQAVRVEPGKFGYQLVRAELTFDEPGTVEAKVRLDRAEPLTVPFTLLAPVEAPG
ncbi:MAG: hypothetical protein H0W25_10945 [Acidimicrobiia bacterium]|nr:hypothetical protein [Acidimicrobiia bacterium]